MGILISVAENVAGYAVEPIGRQVGYLISYEANFKELTDHVNDLERKRDEIRHHVEEERRNGKEIETRVQVWLDDVDGVIGEANQLLKDPGRAKVGWSRWSFPNLVLRHQLGRKDTKMAKHVIEVQGRGNFDRVAYLPALDVASTSAKRGCESFDSRKSIKENIIHALRDPKLSMIGVYGLGGVGKTTLVKEISQIAEKDKLFDAVVMAAVSETPDVKTIQEEIADKLGLRFEEVTVAGRAPRLCQRIKTEKNILIILDDIWERLDLEKVGIPFEGEHKGCKLLMTSRNSDLLRQMGVKKHFRLEVLNEEETWSLFKVMAGDVDEEPSLRQIASQVAKKCAGLPVLIVTVARSLINQDIHAWKDALNQLERIDNEEMQEITYSALELSYKRLKGNEIKALFLLCAAIGEKTMVADLFKYGMGLGIFNNTNRMEDARDRLHKMISALKASCLLLEDDTSTTIKMHDIVREVALSIASRDQHVLTNKGEKLKEFPAIPRRCSQIILHSCTSCHSHHISKLPERLDCPSLKFFYFGSSDLSVEISNSFFEGTESLEVLDLTSMNLASLPTTFCFLTSLQTLCLDHCVLENMDAIGALKNLKILSLMHSSMIKLPSEIGKLTHLRMLDLTSSGIKVIPPNIISSLIRLEELYMGNTFINWEVEDSASKNENASLAELRQLSNLTTLELQIQEAWMLPRDLMFDKLERYKIVIGGVWEWSNIEDGTLKTLNLKLGTNIHLEHGIKGLIKGVENLYLDEVEGIWNVLYQLNGVGFPQLKHLHIQNNAKIKHLIDTMERTHVRVSFPNLETLTIHSLNNMEKICHGPVAIDSFAKLRVIKVENCIQLKYLLSFSVVKGLSQLSEIEVHQCNFMETVVFGDSYASAVNDKTVEKIEFLSLHSLTLQHLHTLHSFFSYELTSSGRNYQKSENYIPIPFFNAQVAFPTLHTLKLSSLNLNKIWEDNQHSVHKLTNLIVESCGGLKYLFSSSMMGSFPNLMRLEISDCHLMEAIIATKERNSNIAALGEVPFSKLETIVLKDMKNLKTIWHNQFDTVKTLRVQNCEKIMVVFPSSMQKAYPNLETLVVTNCALVEEIFAFTSNEKCNIEDTTQLKRITLQRLLNLKQTWSNDPQGILGFHDLENVCLEDCGNLVYLFPFSVATSCLDLKELNIKRCGKMEEIVAQKEGSACTAAIFEFNQLNTLLLWSLLKLKGFYAGNHTLACPSLRKIDVSGCAELNLFRNLSTSNHERLLDGKLDVSVQQSYLIVEQVIPNLEHLRIDEKDAAKILQAENIGAFFNKLSFLGLSRFENEDSILPNWFLQNVYTLKWLLIELSSFKKIFQDERPVNEKICTGLKKLTLSQLHELQHICEQGSQIDPVLEVLEFLCVGWCPSMINLVPSSVSFTHLTDLEVENCNGMINLISSPTARSLAKLITMKVKMCNSLEEIIAEEGDEKIYDIAFLSLETLILECLPRLNRFCSDKGFLRFPLLKEVVVRQCPRMKKFSEGDISTPKLRKVITAQSNKEWHWKGDLNGTIKNMFEVAFLSFKDLSLSKYPELKELWYGQLQHNIFSNLKNLVVHKCEFLSDVLFQQNLLDVLMNLEELDVRDCNSLETVFDVKGIFAEEILSKKCTLMKRLILSNLPKLKHVWKEDPHTALSFQNLCEVSVRKCQSLKSLFPLSVARDITQLQDLEVSDCGIEEIVANERGPEETIKFVFPHLRKLQFRNMPKLKVFFAGIYSLQCKSLKDLGVFNCRKLQLFKIEHMGGQERAIDGRIHVPMHQPLFTVEEVLPNLENFTVDNNDGKIILQSKYSWHQYSKLKHLSVAEFENDDTTFPYWFLENAYNLESLAVQCCSFTKIFQDQRFASEEGQVKICTRLKELTLYKLRDLHHICQEGFQIDPILQLLESIDVGQCSSLVNLVPSPVTFACLTYLKVANCNGLINLITCSTAKSLVKLTTMKIKLCNFLEDVVNGKEDKSNNEISFCSLVTLELASLPRLRRFCSSKCFIQFPSLTEVVVKECPRMEIFSLGDISTPDLQKVQIEENNKENYWESDLNRIIKNMFEDKVAFYRFKQLTLSEYPELKDFWYGEHHNMFSNLRSLVVQRCDFLSDVLFPSNLLQVLHGLEDLEVRDCDSLETVFDVKDTKSKGMLVKQTSQLKRLTLSSLPKLKHIWNQDHHEMISFGNLCTVEVVECQSLLNLFPLSLCQDLKHLENLTVTSCGVREIVSMEDESTENNFKFPDLSYLELSRLEKLKCFYPGRHTLECPSLETLNVYRCGALQMFAFNHSNLPQPHQVEEIHDMLVPQALFSIEKVSPNLEELALNGKDAMMIFNGHCEESIFAEVEILHLQCFYETQISFWNEFLEIFPNLVTLQVRNSSLETLFLSEGIVHCHTKTTKQVRKLWLYELEHLRHVWHEESPLDQLAPQILEDLRVIDCPSLISLVPSSMSFHNLKKLYVDKCKGLTYLITSSIAKSLMQLTTLEVKNCQIIKDVLEIDEEAEEEIIFKNLKYLEFSSLPRLRSFCWGKPTFIFPSLVRFGFRECPQMKIFSSGTIIAPLLTKIEVENKRKWWKDDLNTTIEQLFVDKQEVSHSNDK